MQFRLIFFFFLSVLMCSCVFADTGGLIRKGNMLIDPNGEIRMLTGHDSVVPDITTDTFVQNTGVVIPVAAGADLPVPVVAIPSQTGIVPADEISAAIDWMHINGLTKFTTKESYMPDTLLTREQVTKMIVNAALVLGYKSEKDFSGATGTGCDFVDLPDADPSLQQYILQACFLGLIRGWDGKFWPQEELTKAQILTILIRMFEGVRSDETQTPWRKSYIEKATALHLTKETNPDNFERSIPRGDVALLMYRFKSLSEKRTPGTLISTLYTTSPYTMGTGVLDDTLPLLSQGVSVKEDPELQEAIFWMYQQGMTQYTDTESFRAFDQLQRQEAAKFLHIFHQKFLLPATNVLTGNIPDSCYFSDLYAVQEGLTPDILYVCAHSILKGQDGRFFPTFSMTKAEFVVGLMRMLGKTYETTGDAIWWQPYFDVALQLGIIAHTDILSFEKPITRYEVALLLYRFRVKYELLDNINTSYTDKQFISMVENSEKKVDDLRQGKVYISASILSEDSFDVGYVQLFDTTYKVVKKDVNEYVPSGYVWLGDLYDVTTDQVVGSLSLMIVYNTVLEGSVRPSLTGTSFYEIQKPEYTNSYYIVQEVKK